MKGDGGINRTTDSKGQHRLSVQLFVPGRRWPVRRQLPPCTHRAKDAHDCVTCQKAAEKMQREMQAARARGDLVKKEKGGEPERLPTVTAWMERWVTRGCVGGRKSRKSAPGLTTQKCYADLIRLDIKPSALGRLRLDEVRRRHVKSFLEDQAKANRAASTLQKELSAMARAWREAVEQYEEALCDRADPFDVGVPETKAKASRRALDVDEIRTLLDVIAGHRLLGAWVHLGIDCGARPSELAALEWSDFDLDPDGDAKPTVAICASLAWWPDGAGKAVAQLRGTKTGASGWRRVTLSPSTVVVLKAHRRAQLAEQMRVPGYWPNEQDGIALTGRVFRSDAGKLMHHSNVRHQLWGASTRAGLDRVSPYDLRHSAATLIDEYHDEEVAAKALGHRPASRSNVTAGYIHRRRLPIVDSACLDLALDQANNQKAVSQ